MIDQSHLLLAAHCIKLAAGQLSCSSTAGAEAFVTASLKVQTKPKHTNKSPADLERRDEHRPQCPRWRRVPLLHRPLPGQGTSDQWTGYLACLQEGALRSGADSSWSVKLCRRLSWAAR